MARKFVCERRELSLCCLRLRFAVDRSLELLTIACCLRFVAVLVGKFDSCVAKKKKGQWHRSFLAGYTG